MPATMTDDVHCQIVHAFNEGQSVSQITRNHPRVPPRRVRRYLQGRVRNEPGYITAMRIIERAGVSIFDNLETCT